MAKITNKQIQEINNKCKNNWKLNVQHYLNFSEKTLLKNIENDDKSYLQFSLEYNYNKQISLRISKFNYMENGLAVTEGLGKFKILDETKLKRKSINNLIEFTKALTDEKLLEINNNTRVQESSIVVKSEEF